MAPRRLWWAFSLWNGAGALSALFIDAFLWHRTASLPIVVSYQAGFFVGMLVAFTACRSAHLARLNLTAISGVILTAAMVWVASFGTLAVRFPIPLGLLTGLAYGIFFFAFYNVLQYSVSVQDHDRVSSRIGVWEATIWLTGPLIAGAWLNASGPSGYAELFAVSAVLFAAAAAVAPAAPPLFCPVPSPDSSPEASRRPSWVRLLAGLGLIGLREGSLALLPALWVFVITGLPWLLGLYAAIVAGCEVLGYALPRRFVPSLGRPRLLTLATALAVGGVLVLILAGPTPWSLTVFGGVEAAASACLRTVAESTSLDLIGGRPSGASIAVSAKEQALNGGRLAALVLLLALVATGGLTGGLPYLALFSLLAIPAAVVIRAPRETHRSGA